MQKSIESCEIIESFHTVHYVTSCNNVAQIIFGKDGSTKLLVAADCWSQWPLVITNEAVVCQYLLFLPVNITVTKYAPVMESYLVIEKIIEIISIIKSHIKR